MEYVWLVLGLLMLIIGAELLVKGAVGIALRFRVSMLVVGMTIVSLGTSAPELLVTIGSALRGQADLGLGTVIGSNISNITLVLGVTAIVLPVVVQKDSIKIDWPMMMGATLLFYVLSLDGYITFWEGFLFLFLLVVFTTWLIRQSRKRQNDSIIKEEMRQKPMAIPQVVRFTVLIVVGCVGLAYGADFLVEGASAIARNYAVSERIIGITMVAFGTSVPELITSVVAAYRGKSDISIGNLIGSNLFNILAILGISSMIKEIPVSQLILKVDMIWLLAISALIFPLMIVGKKITRLKGIFLTLLYVIYIFLLF
jgi:cation:H+ antiporter